MLEKALRTYLLAKPAIAKIVGTRIHVGEFIPLKAEDMPAIGIEADPQERQQMIDGTECQMQFPHFDIVIKGQEFSTSIALCNLVASAFRAIPLGALVCTAPGTVYIQDGQALVVGTGTNWAAGLTGKMIHFRDERGNLIHSSTIETVTSATSLTLTVPPSVTQQSLLWDIPSASLAVQIVQVDLLGQWNEKEEETGHGLTIKPRVLKIRVGWLEDTSII